MSRSRLVSTLALAGLALAPLPSLAQGTPQQTHTVKKGDTLWDIAKQYLGDPFKWPEIYRRNTAIVADPNLIYPDQVLVITGDVAATPGTPADSAQAVVTPPAAAPGAATPTPTPEAPMNPDAAPMQQAGPPPAMTIFNPERYRASRVSARQSIEMMVRPTAVRAGDFSRAPFLWDPAGITGAGRIGKPAAPDPVVASRFARPIQLFERTFITVPSNATGAAREEYVAYRLGPVVAGEGQVVVPTGVFRLVSAPQNGQAEAILLSKYEDVFEGQGLLTADPLQMPSRVSPARVEFGLRTTVVYIHSDPVVSSTGQTMILAAGASDGLVPGDQVTIVVDGGTDAQGAPRPPQEVAVLQVTRVTTWGASAILIGQTDGIISVGMAGRVSAKMP